jgi:hypothetical protein
LSVVVFEKANEVFDARLPTTGRFSAAAGSLQFRRIVCEQSSE